MYIVFSGGVHASNLNLRSSVNLRARVCVCIDSDRSNIVRTNTRLRRKMEIGGRGIFLNETLNEVVSNGRVNVIETLFNTFFRTKENTQKRKNTCGSILSAAATATPPTHPRKIIGGATQFHE